MRVHDTPSQVPQGSLGFVVSCTGPTKRFQALTRQRLVDYADRLEVDHVVCRNKGLVRGIASPKLAAQLSAMQLGYLAGYDFICYVDGDVVVRRPKGTPNIFKHYKSDQKGVQVSKIHDHRKIEIKRWLRRVGLYTQTKMLYEGTDDLKVYDWGVTVIPARYVSLLIEGCRRQTAIISRVGAHPSRHAVLTAASYLSELPLKHLRYRWNARVNFGNLASLKDSWAMFLHPAPGTLGHKQKLVMATAQALAAIQE